MSSQEPKDCNNKSNVDADLKKSRLNKLKRDWRERNKDIVNERSRQRYRVKSDRMTELEKKEHRKKQAAKMRERRKLQSLEEKEKEKQANRDRIRKRRMLQKKGIIMKHSDENKNKDNLDNLNQENRAMNNRNEIEEIKKQLARLHERLARLNYEDGSSVIMGDETERRCETQVQQQNENSVVEQDNTELRKNGTSENLMGETAEAEKDAEQPTIKKHAIHIHDTLVSGYDTFHNIPIDDALAYAYSLDESRNQESSRTRSRNQSVGRWESTLGDDNGYETYYFRTYDTGVSDLVIKYWTHNHKKHQVISIPIRKWPEIPNVFREMSNNIQALYGESYSDRYFLGQVSVTKQICRKAKRHNEFTGNRVKPHLDNSREGEVIITIQLTQHILFKLLHGKTLVVEKHLKPGEGYCMRCPEEHSYDPLKGGASCALNFCPRHRLKHSIECAHPPECTYKHDSDSATARLPIRTGPRFAVIFRYFKRNNN